MNPQFALEQCSTQWTFRGGWTWQRFIADKAGLSAISNDNPDIVYFELGANDLDDPAVEPEVIALRAITVAEALLDGGTSLVILGEALH